MGPLKIWDFLYLEYDPDLFIHIKNLKKSVYYFKIPELRQRDRHTNAPKTESPGEGHKSL